MRTRQQLKNFVAMHGFMPTCLRQDRGQDSGIAIHRPRAASSTLTFCSPLLTFDCSMGSK
jgi:hypothetical protein